MPKFAMKISDDVLNMVGELLGTDAHAVFGDDMFVVMELVSAEPFEINAKILSEDAVFEMFKKDKTLEIM